MMKKIFSAMMAFAVLFATSCQNDLDSPAVAGDTSTVSFSVATPRIATRAYSDGTTATKLQYAVYDEEGTLLDELGGEKTINITTTVDLQLVTGNKYTVLFWAAAEGAPYTVDFSNKTMTADYEGATSNDEKRDAFYAVHEFTVNGAQTENVILRRPFAQLNIGANDYEEANKAGYAPEYSAVTVKSIYTTLNLFTGEVTDATEVTFGYAAIPTGETFPVENNKYLAMNYLLVDNTKELIEVEFKYAEEADDAVAKTRTVGSVPVQRNYRTNIYGQLFTSDININVTIDPIYNEPAYEADKLYLAAAIGGEYTLTEDVEISSTLNVQSSLILNLNGYTLKNKADNAQTDVIIVSGSATLTIDGEGTVEAVTGNDGYAAIVEDNATLIINGGTFKAGKDADGAVNAVVYARGNGKVFVNGGNFPNENNSAFVLNKKDADRATTVIEVKGGTFTGFDPANNAAEGAGTNFCAEGYKSTKVGDNYVVVSNEIDAVASTNEELQAALEGNNSNIYLVAGEYTMPATNKFVSDNVITCAPGAVFKGNSKLNINGATIVGATFSNPDGTAVDQTINGTFKGCTFEGSNGGRWCYAGETVVFEDCVFSGSVYGVHFDGGANDVIFRNCTLSGFNALGGALTMVTFEGCTFEGNGKSGYNGANLWGSAKMINCEFTFDGSTGTEWLDCIGASKTYEFTNCTVNGEAYTPDNYKSFDKIFSRNNVTVKINGVDCAM